MKPIKIYPNCSPSKHLCHREIDDVKKITVSFGGGMGGVNKVYHAVSLIEKDDNFYSAVLYTSEIIHINKRFVVLIEARKLVEVVSDITEHSYYNKEKHNKLIETIYYELKENETYEYCDERHSNISQLKRIVEPF